MGSRKSFFLSKPNYIYPTTAADDAGDCFEFEESDLWSSPGEFGVEEGKKQQIPAFRSGKKNRGGGGGDRSSKTVSSSSVPVNVPDWSKILKSEYTGHGKRESDDDDGEDSNGDDKDRDGGRIPPHEYLARLRGASFSVHEGIGRTLKGRDLSRVRNAIWKKTGFED